MNTNTGKIMGAKWVKTEGGSGGRRGHSNMTHWDNTEIIKKQTRRERRRVSKKIVRDELAQK